MPPSPPSPPLTGRTIKLLPDKEMDPGVWPLEIRLLMTRAQWSRADNSPNYSFVINEEMFMSMSPEEQKEYTYLGREWTDVKEVRLEFDDGSVWCYERAE